MGARFSIEHANFVAYLTSSRQTRAPSADSVELDGFLEGLNDPSSLMSSTKGQSDDWCQAVSSAATEGRNALRDKKPGLLAPEDVAAVLGPLREHFSDYNLYCLIIPSRRGRDEESFTFFLEAAISTKGHGLVLMPERGRDFVEYLNPFPAIAELADSLAFSPAVLFWSRTAACVLPLSEAKGFYRKVLVEALEKHPENIERILAAEVKRRSTKQILHLSDLHFGRADARFNRSWLKSHLRKILPGVDATVITGDLFNDPDQGFRQEYQEFRDDLRSMTRRKPIIVVPGNHDFRVGGTDYRKMREDASHVASLGLPNLVVDEDLQAVFFCFNSNEMGDWARGGVSAEQRRQMAIDYEAEETERDDVSKFLKIALVHHHPLKYGAAPAALYERLIAKFARNDDVFTEFENADEFLRWCARREIPLVLHGHKHVPHVARTSVDTQEITVIGCGSTTGVDGRPMCYDIVSFDPNTKRSSIKFYFDPYSDGGKFELQSVAVEFKDGGAPDTDRKSGTGHQRSPMSGEDQRTIIRKVLSSDLDSIRDYFDRMDVWVLGVSSEALRMPESGFAHQLGLPFVNRPRSLEEIMSFLPEGNDFRDSLSDAVEASRRLLGAVSEYNDLRWMSNGGPALFGITEAAKTLPEHREAFSDIDPEQEAEYKRSRLALIERAKAYGYPKRQPLESDEYRADLMDAVLDVRSKCEIAAEALKNASRTIREHELRLL
jgi:UDP-2,3-diacylglucosamine pyrophosphatase LpxH